MKPFRTFILVALALGSVAMPLLWHHRWADELQAKEAAVQKQTQLLAQASAASANSSNAVWRLKSSSELSAAELEELLKLRSEVGHARKATNQIVVLQREIKRLRDGLEDMPTNSQGIVLNCMLNDELPQRMAQVGWLKQWLDENPSERTPELALLRDLDWIRLTDQSWVKTDEENRQTMSQLRLKGQTAFDKMAFKALQQFAQANQGQFPADLSQLKPYFDTPVDDAILQRYQIVDSGTLNMPDLAAAAGELVITQKAPVNPDLDYRSAVSQKRLYHPSNDPGRWDPPK